MYKYSTNLNTQSSPQDLIINLVKRVKKIETMTAKLMDMLQSRGDGGVVKVKEEGEASTTENGINVMRLPSRDVYSFRLQLMDIMFTKEELASSLLFKSKKSDKPGLDKVRVERMLQYMEQRYGNSWDLKMFTLKANQKCRDSRGRLSEESSHDDHNNDPDPE